MQPMWLCILSGRWFEETFENTQWRKVKQMQPMWLCLFSGRPFEDTFENAQWKKSNKCNQCDYSSSHTSHLRRHLTTHRKSQTNANYVTMPPLGQTLWGHIWKHTVEKNQTNATNVTLHPLRQGCWVNIWKHTVEKSQTNAPSVTLPALMRAHPSFLRRHMKKHRPVEMSQFFFVGKPS